MGIAGSFWVNYALLKIYGDDPLKEIQWQIAFGIRLIPAFLLPYSMTTQHESPRWLAEKGHFDETRIVIASLRCLPEEHPDVRAELRAIKEDMDGKTKLQLREQIAEAFSSGKTFYRCSIPFLIMMFQQFTGVNAINYVGNLRHNLRELAILTASSSSILPSSSPNLESRAARRLCLPLVSMELSRSSPPLLHWPSVLNNGAGKPCSSGVDWAKPPGER